MFFLCSNDFVIELNELRCITLTTSPASIVPSQGEDGKPQLTLYLKGEQSPITIQCDDINAARSMFGEIVSLIPLNMKTMSSC